MTPGSKVTEPRSGGGVANKVWPRETFKRWLGGGLRLESPFNTVILLSRQRLTGWAALTAFLHLPPCPGPWSTYSVDLPWDPTSLTDIAAISKSNI